MQYKRIAYSLCGEGFGHYGRSIEIIKGLANRYKDHYIDIYCYDYTYNILMKDKDLPENITINFIPGLRFQVGKRSQRIKFFKSLIFNWNNIKNGFEILKIELVRWFIKPFVKFFRMDSNILYKLSNKHFKEFDVAIVDWEPMLPRVAKLRDLPYISIDSVHIIKFGIFNRVGFTLKDWFYFYINYFFMKLYNPIISKLSIITSIYDFEIKDRFKKNIIEVGPLVRKKIKELSKSTKDDGFVLVYIRKYFRKRILPILKTLRDFNFVVFTEDLTEEELNNYKSENMEFYDIDPDKFLDYLARSKAVISTSGYTLISESVVMKKPFFGVVIGGIFGFEQKISLISLIKSGFGSGCSMREVNREKILDFCNNIEKYKNNLNNSKVTDDTDKVLNIICEIIDQPEKIETYAYEYNK